MLPCTSAQYKEARVIGCPIVNGQIKTLLRTEHLSRKLSVSPAVFIFVIGQVLAFFVGELQLNIT